MEVKHQIQLANVSEILIQDLNEQMDELFLIQIQTPYFQMSQFIIIQVNAKDKVESSVSSVNNFIVSELKRYSALFVILQRSLCVWSL